MGYTDEQKTEALTLYNEHGAAAACRLLDFDLSPATLRVWAHRAGMKRYAPEKTEAATVAHVARQLELREEMRELVLSSAVDMLLRLHEPQFVGFTDEGLPLFAKPNAKDCQALSTAYGILNDKYRLEMGEHTDRTQVVTLGLVERSIEQLESELGKRAPANT